MKFPLLLFVGLLSPLVTIAPARTENPTDVEKLLSTGECSRCDLRGADLRAANLQGANLEGANLEGADLTDANLEGANLR